jgi:hypothetical protein
MEVAEGCSGTEVCAEKRASFAGKLPFAAEIYPYNDSSERDNRRQIGGILDGFFI